MERERIQACAGSMAWNTKGLRAMEMIAAARTRLWPSMGRTFKETPKPARMNENSPICARLAETVSAVFNG